MLNQGLFLKCERKALSSAIPRDNVLEVSRDDDGPMDEKCSLFSLSPTHLDGVTLERGPEPHCLSHFLRFGFRGRTHREEGNRGHS